MKTLKILLAVCVLCFVNNTQGQSDKFAEFVNMTQRKDISKFTKSDWEALFAMWGAIKINGIKLDNIWEIKGDKAKLENKIEKLFFADSDMKKGINSEDYLFFESKKKGLYLDFYGGRGIYYFSSFSITNRNSNITIMGVTLTIGESIDKLKNVKVDYKDNEIFFRNGECGGLFIVFDSKTKKITKIKYSDWCSY